MFTGIVEALGEILERRNEGGNASFLLKCPFTHELKVDQSVSHNGVCLTVTQIEGEAYWVTAVHETLLKTNLAKWEKGDLVNLERCLQWNGRLDGHLVQGHVDTTAHLSSVADENGSWRLRFTYKSAPGFITVEKGSVCVNGVSLTVINSTDDSFEVAIIPFTWEHTNFHRLQQGDVVNLEFDILGKYIARLYAQGQPKPTGQ
jgi:riboflavin synthase